MSASEARDQNFHEEAEARRVEMEELALRIKTIVLSQPAEDLLGYLWGQLLLFSTMVTEENMAHDNESEIQRDTLFYTLEYVHAVLSCFNESLDGDSKIREDTIADLLEAAKQIKIAAMHYSMFSSLSKNDLSLGFGNHGFEINAKTTWVSIRGNRYQSLEDEFFRFILKPHDDALLQAYGIGSSEVADGIQRVTDSMRLGFGEAMELIQDGADFTHSLAEKHGISPQEAIEMFSSESPKKIDAISNAYKDLFFGGICNLSRHTTLPTAFLEDLSFKRGENEEFFQPGLFCGTPLRTLPARIKPLIRLKDGFYATDPYFVRDTAYRAIQRGLVTRLPEYREEWNQKQKEITESAFPDIFRSQLKGGGVYQEVYYRDPISNNWVESDTIVILDDVLIQIEAKAGLGAMDSPATNLSSHIRAVQNLVVKAYRQTKRFFEYLESAPEVPLYRLHEGSYEETRRISLSDFRIAIPIGLTVEAFTPFSTMCKELPEIEPLLGKYPFVSMSIDDLFILNRILPTTGELMHYLSVRQQVAGIRRATLFDEIDHLGAYIAHNRFDLTLREQLNGDADQVLWDAYSAEIDRYFMADRWLHEPPPSQKFPKILVEILGALSKYGHPGWMKFDALIRDMGTETREMLGEQIETLKLSLDEHSQRWFYIYGESVFFIWICRDSNETDLEPLIHQAEAIAIASRSSEVQALCLPVDANGNFTKARGLSVNAPSPKRADYQSLQSKAERAREKMIDTNSKTTNTSLLNVSRKLGRNERCWCGSGLKYKKCHGAPVTSS